MAAYTLENQYLKAVFEAGEEGFVISSIKSPRGEEWLLWREAPGIGPAFDDVYKGGMEWMFPNDAPESYAGFDYPDHGCLWQTGYELQQAENMLKATAKKLPWGIEAVQEASLEENKLCFKLNLYNRGKKPLPYICRLHPAFIVNDGELLKADGESILFERDEAGAGFYLDFGQSNAENAYPKVAMSGGEGFSIEETAAYPDEMFCHIKLKAFGFAVERRSETLNVEWDEGVFEGITLYFCKMPQGRVLFPEPAAGLGSTLKAAKGRRVLQPGKAASFSCRLVFEGNY